MLRERGVTFRYNCRRDIEQLFRMNLEAFGEDSYFHDERFLHGFERLIAELDRRGSLRVTTVLVAGAIAAVDVGAVWRNAYTVLAGGTNRDFPGVAKLINFHHLEVACRERFDSVDFLCGDFGWKRRFRLVARPLYQITLGRRRRTGAFRDGFVQLESSPMLDRRRPNGRSEPNGRSRVLVVGTTPDYVDLLRREHPEECLFLTESRLRLQAKEPHPDDDEEVLYRGDKQLSAIELLKRHQERYGIKIAGVACFDCESMPLASLIAKRFGLPYPSSEAVDRCRNKRRMKQRWRAGGTPTPRFSIVSRSEEAVEFLHQIGGPCVMKPLSGSGSELVFRVENEADCRLSFGEDHRRSRSAPDCSTLPVLQGGASKRSDGGMG